MEPVNSDENPSHKQDEMTTFSQPSLTKPKISTLTRKLTHFLSTDQDSEQGPREKRARLVSKRGRVNIVASNVERRHHLYLSDAFTTLIDWKWYWIALVFSGSFITSWIVFGTIWWLIVWLRSSNLSPSVCIENVNSWTSAFLFSVETQTTIGYGGRQITPNCPEGVLLLLLQSITGLTISASLMGLIFAKVSRPRPRAQTLLFSSNAVINSKNCETSLSFRVGDVRKSQLLEVTIKLHFFRFGTNRHNEKILVDQVELPITFCPGSEPEYEVRPFFLTPLTISHVIDDKSPLYGYKEKGLLESDIEIVAVLEGVVEATGMVTQAKTSYLPDDILWDHDFRPMTIKSCNGLSDRLHLDFSRFDKTYCIKTMQKSLGEDRPKKRGIVSKPESNGDVWLPRQPLPM